MPRCADIDMEKADIDVEKYEIFPLRGRSEFIKRAAGWFSSKWNISEREYAESIIKSLHSAAVPQWYLATAGERIVGGAGVIENDFHNRKDLAPNVCWPSACSPAATAAGGAWRGNCFPFSARIWRKRA